MEVIDDFSESEKWEMPQDAFEDLLASTPMIQECGNWKVETLWTAVADAENRRHDLLWLQRSICYTQGDHKIVTFSKPTPVARRRKRTLSERAAEHAAAESARRLRLSRRIG